MCLIAEAKDTNLLTIIPVVLELLMAKLKNTLKPKFSSRWAGPVLLVSPEFRGRARGETESLGARTPGAEERRRVITKYSTRYIVTQIRSQVIFDRSQEKNINTEKV